MTINNNTQDKNEGERRFFCYYENKMFKGKNTIRKRFDQAIDKQCDLFVNNKYNNKLNRASKLMILLLLVVGLFGQTSQAEQASSEVWSESDGLQLKYSTNHEDLLGSRGSELILSSNQHKEATDPSQAATGEAPASASGESAEQEQEQQNASNEEQDAASQVPSSAEQSSTSNEASSEDSSDPSASLSGNAEQAGADSHQQSDRIPASPLKQDSVSSRQKQQSSLNEPPSLARYPYEESSSATNKNRKQQNKDMNFLSFKSALEDTDDGAETSNVDHGANDYATSFLGSRDFGSQSSFPSDRFRQPGKLFKEAIRATSSSVAKVAPVASNDNDGEVDESGNEEMAPKSSTKEEKKSTSLSFESNSVDDSSEDTKPTNKEKDSDGNRYQQHSNMIDFDRALENNNNNNNNNRFKKNLIPEVVSSALDDSDNQGDGEQDSFGSSEGKNHQQQGEEFNQDYPGERYARQHAAFFSDQSSQRTMAAGSSAHKERASIGMKQSAVRPTNPNAYKQLSYFKGVQQADERERRPNMRNVESHSPDNVRDDFISPGHYPGSMPYLNQAASELQKKQLVSPSAGEESNIKTDDKKQESASAIVTKETKPSSGERQLLASGTSYTSGPLSNISKTDASPEPPLIPLPVPEAQVQVRAQADLPVQVTPEPESQAESQQIMAPILMSTTTMGPMPATSSPPANNLTKQSSTTTEIQAATTTQAPTLKRFKFRKYR